MVTIFLPFRKSTISMTLGILLCLGLGSCTEPQPITTMGQPGQLQIGAAGDHALRITLKPQDYDMDSYGHIVFEDHEKTAYTIDVTELRGDLTESINGLEIKISPNPLTITVTNEAGEMVQQLVFDADGNVEFAIDESPILGLGEGGPKPEKGANWREDDIEFDRKGRLHKMLPRWQATAYGSRNPVSMLVGTGGWGLWMVTPWGQVDLSSDSTGVYTPITPDEGFYIQQNQKNQQENTGKGIPPKYIPGLYDVYVFDGHDPKALMKDISTISGPAVMPPKWTMGYMQSHRTLETDKEMMEVVDNFREKEIPMDAVIYLGTGFTPVGWNTEQPSFEFNPEVFKRSPQDVIDEMHSKNTKVVMHVVPWDRDRLATLHGSIPPKEGETVDSSHILTHWKEHESLMNIGVDAFWPDEGDWFNLFERLERHKMYYQGPLSTKPNERPWSLHRNGYLGIAQWGGWIWSGDTDSSWKTLEGQIAVGINSSLSLSPYWGSDIGGFYPNDEYTGELFARWFQFSAFCPSFRSHGRTWWTHLPWGWGLSERGPLETRTPPLESEMNNNSIEPITKAYAELRYQLLPYNYTLTWEAREEGLPMMRALWLHYPEDSKAKSIGDEYLWGEKMLIAPIFEKGATGRSVYLPEGTWYDWWTGESHEGGKTVQKEVDLTIMPMYVGAGAIIPMDPIRQYTDEEIDGPTTIKVWSGADGTFELYSDDGKTLDYLDGEYSLNKFQWNDADKTMTIEAGEGGKSIEKEFIIELMPSGEQKNVSYSGEAVSVTF
ncbi:TIM-barrel domain-containing protein [Flagellimonas iocasae]|uniref:TIM-barrel domain-containing protein n=1 Tax=Flagellimonas iocasae TaxID=2055905 RepID=A0ABW4XTY0_9FLAO